MTHIITGLCLRHGGCVQVCPVNCIAPGEPMDEWPTYYIDPARCTDCGLCVPACPYNAIWPQDDVPTPLQDDIQPNYDYFRGRGAESSDQGGQGDGSGVWQGESVPQPG